MQIMNVNVMQNIIWSSIHHPVLQVLAHNAIHVIQLVLLALIQQLHIAYLVTQLDICPQDNVYLAQHIIAQHAHLQLIVKPVM